MSLREQEGEELFQVPAVLPDPSLMHFLTESPSRSNPRRQSNVAIVLKSYGSVVSTP